MKLKLEMAEEKHVLNELNARKSIASLTQKKDELLSLSMERGRVIQVIKEFVLFTKKYNSAKYEPVTSCLYEYTGETRRNPAAGEEVERREKISG